MYVSRFNPFVAALLLMSHASAWATQGLTLQQAEKIAIQRDTVSKSYEQRAMAFNEQAKASNTWSDPRLKFGAQAVPIDTFDIDQEPMTQIVLGYQQMLPRGNSNEIAAQSISAMSRMQVAKSYTRQREVIMNVRQAWLDVVLHQKSIKIIQANRHLFVKMMDISESFYAAGRQQQQDVVQAQLEISLVDDRLEQTYSMLMVARAKLAKWVGEESVQNGVEVESVNLQLKPLPDVKSLNNLLKKNPQLIAVSEKVISQQSKLRLADEQYNPQWGFDINYGIRSGKNSNDSDRTDFLSAMVTLDLPIFTENKQDRTLAAERQRLQAVRYDQIDVKRILIMQLQQVLGRLEKLQDRHQLYIDRVLPQARQNAEVSLNGYQSGVVSFFTLTRARITELNTRLSDLQIDVAYNKAYAELQYLIGEKS